MSLITNYPALPYLPSSFLFSILQSKLALSSANREKWFPQCHHPSQSPPSLTQFAAVHIRNVSPHLLPPQEAEVMEIWSPFLWSPFPPSPRSFVSAHSMLATRALATLVELRFCKSAEDRLLGNKCSRNAPAGEIRRVLSGKAYSRSWIRHEGDIGKLSLHLFRRPSRKIRQAVSRCRILHPCCAAARNSVTRRERQTR